MKTTKPKLNDELRPEYDLNKLKVRKVGLGRTGFGHMVRLEPDVVAAFPDAAAVNDTLRNLIKIAKRSARPAAI